MLTSPPTQLQLNRRAVISNIAILFSGSALSQGVTFLALLLTVRQLGAIHYGQYAACFTLASFSSIMFSLGLDIWLLREGSRNLVRLGEFLGSVLTIKGIVGLGWFGLITLLPPLLNSNLFPAELIRLSALSVWLESLFATVLTAYKASLRNRIVTILGASSNTLWLLATLLLIRSGAQQVAVYMQIRAGVLLFSLIVAVLLTWYCWALPTAAFQTIKRAIHEALPFAISELLAWTSMRLDVLIIAFVLGQYAVGLYSPATGIVNALFMIPATVYMVIVPVLSNLFVTNVKQAWLTAKRSVLLLAAVGIGLFLALAVGARSLTSLLGTSFRGSQEVMQILSLVPLLHSLTFGMAAILVATNQQVYRTLVQAIAVVANMALNLLVVRWAGIYGVAVVYVVTEIVLLVGYAWLVRNCCARSTLLSSSKSHERLGC